MEKCTAFLTNQDMHLSLGLSFLLIPSGLIGVRTSSSRNSSSSSGAMAAEEQDKCVFRTQVSDVIKDHQRGGSCGNILLA